MGAIRPAATSTGSIIIIVAVQTGDGAAGGERGNQAGDIRIFSYTGYRVVGRVAGIKFKSYIGLLYLSRCGCGGFPKAIAMATVTQFLYVIDGCDLTALLVDTGYSI